MRSPGHRDGQHPGYSVRVCVSIGVVVVKHPSMQCSKIERESVCVRVYARARCISRQVRHVSFFSPQLTFTKTFPTLLLPHNPMSDVQQSEFYPPKMIKTKNLIEVLRHHGGLKRKSRCNRKRMRMSSS